MKNGWFNWKQNEWAWIERAGIHCHVVQLWALGNVPWRFTFNLKQSEHKNTRWTTTDDHLVSCKTTLMSCVLNSYVRAQIFHRYKTDWAADQIHTTVYMCLWVFQSINMCLLKCYRLQFLHSCSWTLMPVLHFYVCVLVEGGPVCECVWFPGHFSCDWTPEDPAELVLLHQAARTDLRK